MPDIVLKGKDNTIKKERTAGSALTPGYLVERNSSGEVVPHGTAAGTEVTPAFHVPGPAGQDIDTDSPSGSNAHYRVCSNGVEVYAWLAAGENVSEDQVLESAGDGTLQADTAAGADFPVRTLEGVDNSGATSAARIKVEVIDQ